MNQLAEVEKQNALVGLPLTPQQTKDVFDQIQKFKQSFIDKSDIVEIQQKAYIKKSGWRKLAFAFNLSDEIVREEKQEDSDVVVWRIWTKVSAPNGRSVVAVGSCASDERKFSHVDHDVYAMAHTRSKNRAISDILGLGDVSAEELGQPEHDEPAPKSVGAGPAKPASPPEQNPLTTQNVKRFDFILDGEPYPVGEEEKPFPNFFIAKVCIPMTEKNPGSKFDVIRSGDLTSIIAVEFTNLPETKYNEIQKALEWTLTKVDETRRKGGE